MTNAFEMGVGIIRLLGSHPGELLLVIGIITVIVSVYSKEDKENNKRNLLIGGIVSCIIGFIILFLRNKK